MSAGIWLKAGKIILVKDISPDKDPRYLKRSHSPVVAPDMYSQCCPLNKLAELFRETQVLRFCILTQVLVNITTELVFSMIDNIPIPLNQPFF